MHQPAGCTLHLTHANASHRTAAHHRPRFMQEVPRSPAMDGLSPLEFQISRDSPGGGTGGEGTPQWSLPKLRGLSHYCIDGKRVHVGLHRFLTLSFGTNTLTTGNCVLSARRRERQEHAVVWRWLQRIDRPMVVFGLNLLHSALLAQSRNRVQMQWMSWLREYCFIYFRSVGLASRSRAT